MTPGDVQIGEQSINPADSQLKVSELGDRNDELRQSRKEIKHSVAQQEEKMQRLESSQIKTRQF